MLRAERHALVRSEATTDGGFTGAETDGGRSDDDSPALATYTDGEYGYRIAYPVGWSVGRNMMGATTFEATESSDAGVAVFVERDGPTADSAATLLDDHDDGSVHALDVLAQRETALQSGQSARAVECAYRDQLESQGYEATIAEGEGGFFAGVLVIDRKEGRFGFLEGNGSVTWISGTVGGIGGLGSAVAQNPSEELQNDIEELQNVDVE